MEFSVPVFDLKKIMSIVKDVVPSRSVSQEESGVLMEVMDGRVMFSAVGGNTIVKVETVVNNIKEPGKCVINSSVFSAVVNSFVPMSSDSVGTGDVCIRKNKNQSLVMYTETSYKNGNKVKNKRDIPLLNTEFFPALPNCDMSGAMVFPGGIFRDSVERVYYAASSSEGDVISGIHMRLSDREYVCSALDGVKLAEYKSPVDSDASFDFVIPLKTAIKAAKSISPINDIRISATDKILWVSSPGILIGAVLVNGSFPDYDSALGLPEVVANVDRKILLDNIRNLDFIDVEDNRVILNFDKNVLSLQTKYAKNEAIALKFDHSKTVHFNMRLLRATVQSIFSDTINIGMSSGDTVSAVFFSPAEPDPDNIRFRAVLMPMRPE